MKVRSFLKIGAALGLLYSSALTQAELVASWSFEEEDARVVKDVSENGHDGTVVGEPHYVEGVSGHGLAFNGEDVYVEIANSTDDSPLSLTEGNYTITCWVKFNNLEGVQRVINRDNGEDYAGGYSLALINEMVHLDTNDGEKRALNVAAVSPKTWYFFGITYDKESGSRKVYVNGELAVSDNIGTGGMKSRPADQLWFGSIPKYGQYFSGVLDEVRVYNEALSSRKISEMVANPAIDGKAP